LTEELELLENAAIERLSGPDINWYWVDITGDDETDTKLLSEHFNFHNLAVLDCLHYYERPKVDFYDKYNFFVLSALNQNNLKVTDLNLFVGGNYIVSYHKKELPELDSVRQRVIEDNNAWAEGHYYVAYLIFDKIVDQYFPAVYQIEDKLGRITISERSSISQNTINKVFNLRDDLIKLRRTINSMKELLYRMLNSEHLQGLRKNRQYFNDIYDHLLRLSDTIESNREITADMRDSYISLNSNRMNEIMTILTIVTSIFIPLTFIAGIYGMNFANMPELEWKYGYFITLGVMAVIGVAMFFWFKAKGWFKIYK
jgi:magnesium transporter